MAKRYTVSDGKLVLTVEEAEEGGYIVTSPLDPGLVTEAETISEAFENARDAMKALVRSRSKLLKQNGDRGIGRVRTIFRESAAV
jgi:antitoxin HicB